MNQNIDLKQPTQLQRSNISESDLAEGDLENFELWEQYNSIIFLLIQMGYSLRAALLCVQLTQSSDSETVLRFVLPNELGVYTHPFLEEGKKKLCIICNDDQTKHNSEVSPKSLEKGRKISI